MHPQVMLPPNAVREKCPNTDFFWSVFSPNTGKYGPEKTPYLDTFHAVMFFTFQLTALFPYPLRTLEIQMV